MLGKCISGIRISKILLGDDPDPQHGLRNFGALRVRLHTTWSAPQAKNPTYAPGIAPKSLEIDQDNLNMKFSTSNVDYNNLSIDNFGSWSPPHGGVKFNNSVITSGLCYYCCRASYEH